MCLWPSPFRKTLQLTGTDTTLNVGISTGGSPVLPPGSSVLLTPVGKQGQQSGACQNEFACYFGMPWGFDVKQQLLPEPRSSFELKVYRNQNTNVNAK